MKLNAFPQPPKSHIEKPVVKEDELVNQVDVIEGVLGKLKAQTEAANDESINYVISKIDKDFSRDTSDKIFKIYNKLIATTDNIDNFLRGNFRNADNTKEASSKIKESILQYANKLLINSSNVLIGLEFQHQQTIGSGVLDRSFDENSDEYWEGEYKKMEQEEVEKLEAMLEQINVDQTLFLNSFKSLKEEGAEFSLEDINNSSFREVPGGDITPEQATEMKRIYSENQSDNAEVQKDLVEKFASRLNDGKTRFYTFTYAENTQSFIAFTPHEDGISYASAFNVAPNARGYKIGEAMLHEAMDKEAREHILTADCDSKLPISAKYIETGWVATRYWDNHGDKILDIVRNDREREKYVGKQLTQEEILAGNIREGTLVKTAGEQKDLPFELCNEGYVLTRMLRDQKTNQYYAVFEPAPPAHTELETDVGASHK